MDLTVTDVIEGLTGQRLAAPQPIESVVIDSRQAEPGSLFIALPGTRTDGHQFVADVFQRGARMALVHQPCDIEGVTLIKAGEPFNGDLSAESICVQVEDTLQGLQQLAAFWRNKLNPHVIGITGSVGKSTTKELITTVLSTRYNVLKNEGNFNNEIGLPLTLLNLEAAHERVVLEMGMYALGEIALLADIARPQVGVITNVGPTHLERLGTIERIAQAKTELVQALPSESEGGIAILNYDDPLVMPMAQETEAKVFTYGLLPEADLWASNVESAGLEGIRFTFNYQAEEIHVKVPLLGRHSVHTALRAALVGLIEGLDWEEIINGLQTLPNTEQLRLVAMPGPNRSILLDDTYNASPASTLAALNLLDDLPAAKKIAVLGDMLELGSYAAEGHRKVGCRAADILDQLIVIGPLAQFIAEEAAACGLDSSMIFQLADNQAAIKYLETTLGPDDVVLVKGSNAQHLDDIVLALMTKRDASSRVNKA